METLNYRHLLKKELSERAAKNQSYSLRAFARDLEVEPAQLSRVLKGTQNISLQSAQNIARKIYKQKKEQELFLSLVALSLAKKPSEAAAALAEVKRKNISVDYVELSWIDVISDWYHMAIAELVTLPRAPRTPQDISKYLGLSVPEVDLAIDRLLQLGILRNVGGRYRKSSHEIATPSGVPSAAIRRYHKQMIEKALESVDTQDVSERFLYGRTMTIKKADLPQLEALTREYLHRLSELSQDTEACDSLYQVNIQTFNLKRGNK